jgi:hypothetical protein
MYGDMQKPHTTFTTYVRDDVDSHPLIHCDFCDKFKRLPHELSKKQEERMQRLFRLKAEEGDSGFAEEELQ